MKRSFLVVLIIFTCAAIAFAVPNQIAFQGRLNTDIGTPIEGSFPVVFSLYDVPTGGTPVWTESQTVEFNSGLFVVQLGSVTPIPDETFTGGTFYIEMTIDGELLESRKPLTSVPYAFNALNAETGDDDWQIDGIDMRNLNDGNVVIGAASPLSTNRLEVHGNAESGEKAIVGISSTGPEGWLGTTLHGAYGQYDSDNYGYLGGSGIGIFAHGTPQAAQLEGTVNITGDLTIESNLLASATSQLVIDGDAGADDVLMTDASGMLYWADGSGIGGDDWGTQVAEVNPRLTGDGTVSSPLDIAQMGAGDGEVLTWNTGAGAWEPRGSAGADDWGSQVAQVSPRLTGDGTESSPLDIAEMGATSGQALVFDGSAWAPSDVATDGDDWGTQVAQVAAPLEGDGTATDPISLPSSAATDQILKYDGSSWVLATDESGTGGDNWGSQVVQSSARFTGDGTSGSPLELASMGASSGQVLSWDGSNWVPDDAGSASDDEFVNGASFGTGDGVLTLTRDIGTDLTVDLDGRYLEAGADNSWTDAGDYIYPNNAPSFHIEDDGDLDLGGNNLESVNEISANTIDPVLKINGKLFRTWTTDQVGQKTVVEGVKKLDDHGYFEIDLAKQPEASNLWLFYNSVVEETIIPFVTPHGPDHLYANVKGSKLIVGSTDQKGGTSFSFRLSGIRKDFRGMSEEETNIRTKETDVYIDIDGGSHYLDNH